MLYNVCCVNITTITIIIWLLKVYSQGNHYQGKCSDSWGFEGDLFTMAGYPDFWQYIYDPTLYSCNSCRDLYRDE